ncbi:MULTISPECIES: hypothetical protein [Bacillus]|uniref:hypothetical protein n=1 Tax=Bacillus TaxID=1386 RepID=UPI000B5DA8A7|nr:MULTISPECIES: hypothetical protein [Bacillus]OXB95136.1 hypothetical protein CGQ22_31100 [Bacillus sp. M13(2017)]QCY65056.1 hypothetical protein FHE73_30850 [Bacillus thuringiensis]QCY65069.1 hypothetical protein FHE73_30935 [Bacillus thuringiensis]
MGTLFNQRPRYEHEEYAIKHIDTIIRISKEKGITIEETIMCLKYSMAVNNWDCKDEQLAGFGKLLKELIETVQDLKREDNTSEAIYYLGEQIEKLIEVKCK